SSARDTYLEGQVLTATPQRLRLMLLDAAVRYVRQAQAAWSEQNVGAALEFGERARAILSELTGAIRRDDTELTRRVLALYTYLYQSLATALLEQNPEPLSRIAELLDYERETWRQVCEQLAQG